MVRTSGTADVLGGFVGFRPGALRFFVAVAEEGQMTRAAAKLQIAQPVLSKAISQLESDIGFKLLERHARGVTLTPLGASFLEHARIAIAAEDDAFQTAQHLARARSGAIDFGFVGASPGLDSPGPMTRFARIHPEVDIHYRELAFPGSSTAQWLSDVDIAVCHLPPADENVWSTVLRVEPRAVLVRSGHRLANRSALTVAEVIGETFIGYNPAVDAVWAGFWSLDDHRGAPPARLTPDEASAPQEVLAALAVRDAVTTVPSSSAALLVNVMTGLESIPLTDANPTTFVLAGRRDRRSALVDAFVEFTTRSAGSRRQAAGSVP
jgi:DNA-binding transcriptional LysR family regulator